MVKTNLTKRQLSLMQRYIGQIQFYLTNGNCWVDHKLHRRSRDEVWQMIYILLAEKNVATTSPFFL